MKAVGLNKFGGPEVLEYIDVPEPDSIGSEELLIEVEAIGVNRADLLIRQGIYPVEKTFPVVPGFDVAGKVKQVGTQVKGFQKGQSVFSLVDIDGYSELVKVNSHLTLPFPGNLSSSEAAAIPTVVYTVWITLFKLANLRKGETVLIHAAGSGVGIAAIQLAKYFGAQVITTASTDEKLKRAQEFGADYLINYSHQDFASEVKKITEGKGVAVILDGIGASTLAQNISAISKGGRLILIGGGGVGGLEGNLHLGRVIMKSITLIGFNVHGQGTKLYQYVQEFQQQILPLFAQGKIVSVIDKVFTLREAREAHVYLAERKNFGKVVLRP
ncbi:MAG: NADPH quinone oxidoreductase [candidate division Zixibacteria bacterium RBG-1]|nr:MAG: NADPH quinone oxidoreductase [candidate division Zixibacteria bacterium RBG-1]OGC84088.1 MAG: hypothetical protein A2V73_00485 [candidate division Zixibacteria bacterium RBG_19FT_COMBO_42_43]